MNKDAPLDPTQVKTVVNKLGIWETIQNILAKDGIGAFWRGIGPALVLVINPVIQYTVFEQLKNLLVKRRTTKLRAAGGIAGAVAVLSDWDYFFLGALSKLGDISFPSFMYLPSRANQLVSSGHLIDLPLHVMSYINHFA